MKTLLLTLSLIMGMLFPNPENSMLGIKINDSEKELNKITLELIASDKSDNALMSKYTTQNGNDFSVTIRKGRIVYLENDWLQDSQAKKPLITDFIFGETTLKDIRKTFGTNGFTYSNVSYNKTELI